MINKWYYSQPYKKKKSILLLVKVAITAAYRSMFSYFRGIEIHVIVIKFIPLYYGLYVNNNTEVRAHKEET